MKLPEGLFAFDGEAMPCHPQDITVTVDAVGRDTLSSKAEAEVVARVLALSANHGHWVGVSWRELNDIYTTSTPVMMNGVVLHNHNPILTAVHELIKKGYLRLETEERDKDALFPTPALVAHIMQTQRDVVG